MEQHDIGHDPLGDAATIGPALGHRFGELSCPAVIIGQAVHHLLERDEPAAPAPQPVA